MRSKDIFRRNFGPSLTKKLSDEGINQRTFALEIIGCDPQLITAWLRGTRPSPERIKITADHFECDYQVLLATGIFADVNKTADTDGTIKALKKLSSTDIAFLRSYNDLSKEGRRTARAMIETIAKLETTAPKHISKKRAKPKTRKNAP